MVLFLLRSAAAATQCMSADAFNTWMQTHEPSTDVTLRFDATGVNPYDWWGTKGALADLTDTSCAAGGSLALKVYGPDDPPNTSHPTGTLKQEYGYNCGPMPNEEHWADPNASEEIFRDGSERCDVTIWINPANFGYRLECDHGTWEGSAENGPAMPVNQVTIFALSDGHTWEMPNATSTWNEVCFETDGTVPEEEEDPPEADDSFRAIHDVTVTSTEPANVYPDPMDLCVEASYSEVYLQFDLSSVAGTITSAQLELTAGSDGSANGDGAEVWAVSSTSWDEDTLTWNGRPGVSGSAMGRVGPIVPDGEYSVDVSAAVSAPGVYAFALAPTASDTNGAHFQSDEMTGDQGPRLRITWVEDESGGDGGGDDGGGDGAGDDEENEGGGRDDTAGIRARPGDGQAMIGADPGCGCATPIAPGTVLAFGAAIAAFRRVRRT